MEIERVTFFYPWEDWATVLQFINGHIWRNDNWGGKFWWLRSCVPLLINWKSNLPFILNILIKGTFWYPFKYKDQGSFSFLYAIKHSQVRVLQLCELGHKLFEAKDFLRTWNNKLIIQWYFYHWCYKLFIY